MKYLIGILFFTAILVNNNHAQVWDWESLSEYPNSTVSGLNIYNGNLIATGGFTHVGTLEAPAISVYNGTEWESFDPSFISATGGIGGIKKAVQYGDSLVVIGGFDSINGVPSKNVAMWDGLNWVAMSNGANDLIEDVIVYNNEVFVAGKFDTIGGNPIQGIAKWNSGVWETVGGGVKREIGKPHGTMLCVFENKLIFNGAIDTVGNVPCNNIGVWDGANWSTIPAPWHFPFYAPMIEWQGKLIMVTSVTYWSDEELIIQMNSWDGSAYDIWSIQSMHNVGTFGVYQNELYAAGSDGSYNFGSVVSKWNGSEWEMVGSNLDDAVFSLCEFNSELYAGGWFTGEHNYLTKLVNVTSLKEEHLNSLMVYPNPTTGQFTVSFEMNESQNISVEVVNLIGEKVIVKTATNVQNQNLVFDMSNVADGVYFVVITTENEQVSKKLIVRK